MEPSSIQMIARHVMKLLVERRFDELEEATDGVQLSASEIEDVVDEVGTLVMPPEPSWHSLHVQAVRNWPGAFNVRMDLWTAKGRADFTVEMTLSTKKGKPVIELEDIGVR